MEAKSALLNSFLFWQISITQSWQLLQLPIDRLPPVVRAWRIPAEPQFQRGLDGTIMPFDTATINTCTFLCHIFDRKSSGMILDVSLVGSMNNLNRSPYDTYRRRNDDQPKMCDL
jgi:hypothetical protein